VTSVAVFVLLLATSIWIGGFVAIVIVARAARHELDLPTQIAFFRRLGRRYLVVAGGSLAVALTSGGTLLALSDWTPTKTVAVALGLTLALATVVGVIQARDLTRIRARNLVAQNAASVEGERSAVARAALLRAGIGALTFALLAVGSAIAR
jgi:uncharacterized membrane protein